MKILPSLDPNFIKAINILEKNKINYWVCHGTLLGIIRDHKLIEWDHDIDLAVLEVEVSRKKIVEIFLKHRFKLREGYGLDANDIISFSNDEGRIVDINFYKKININGKIFGFVEWLIPRNTVMKIIDALSMASKYKGVFYKAINSMKLFENFFKKVKILLIKKNIFNKKIGYCTPFEFIHEIRVLRFENLSIKIPNEPEQCLEHIYGKNWKTPKKDFVWYKDAKNLYNSKN